jgi:hypothetical protein
VDERRRLAGMLPGAEIEAVSDGEFVALVRDVDAPIPVLVERGGYSYAPAGATASARRSLVREGVRLLLVADRAEFERIVRRDG